MYVGEVENGKPNGLGIETIFIRGGIAFKYVGEWKDGKKHGQATMIYPDGGCLTVKN